MKGIAVAGTILTDIVKTVEKYPEKGMLTTITDIKRAVGGCVPNTAIDLAVIDPELPVYAMGTIGNDGNGQYVCDELALRGINTDNVWKLEGRDTGFTDVMTEAATGDRTFFTTSGANAEFDPGEGFFLKFTPEILHIGYITLMGKLDCADSEYGTLLARRLCEAQKAGIKTSIDVVSNEGADFYGKVVPSLKFCDYAVMNEIEACSVAGLDARDKSGKLIMDNLYKALENLFALGVKRAAVIHCPELGVILTKDGMKTVPSLSLPQGYVKGSVGAGDAFCAACLYGFYNNYEPEKILEFAAAAAACNLSAIDSVSGMKPRDEIFEMNKKFKRRVL